MSSPEVFTFGETMALFSADPPGPLANATSCSVGIGGAESNTAVALRRLGHTVQWTGRVGDDPLGELVAQRLLGEGLDQPVIDPDATTGTMIREQRTPDHLRITYWRRGSAGSRLHIDDLDRARLKAARFLHITGISPALSASAHHATVEAVRVARQAGVQVSLDLNYRAALWSPEEAGRMYAELAPLADILFCSDTEAALLVGNADSLTTTLDRLAGLGPREVIVKRGHDGCLARLEGQTFSEPAQRVTVVNTVGAGDAFNAGYLSGRLDQESPQASLSRAAAVAAFVCMAAGDWEGAPRRKELRLLSSADSVVR